MYVIVDMKAVLLLLLMYLLAMKNSNDGIIYDKPIVLINNLDNIRIFGIFYNGIKKSSSFELPLINI